MLVCFMLMQWPLADGTCTETEGVRYQLKLLRDWLMLLQHEWDRYTTLLRPSHDAPAWGPSTADIKHFRDTRRRDAVELIPSFTDSGSDSDSNYDNGVVEPDEDSMLIDLLDHMDLVEDNYE